MNHKITLLKLKENHIQILYNLLKANPPLSHIYTDPLYQMNQQTTFNPNTISQPVNMAQPVISPFQYIPIQQDTFINTSASIPEPIKHFDGLDYSYTPEEHYNKLKQDSPL